ncbi:MAG: hypothetical protein K0R98_694 [Rickettsiaceae bacterium]|jgi:hypothetical protein|nr:hypothetical protein [Rickettsiaceae bacterium]
MLQANLSKKPIQNYITVLNASEDGIMKEFNRIQKEEAAVFKTAACSNEANAFLEKAVKLLEGLDNEDCHEAISNIEAAAKYFEYLEEKSETGIKDIDDTINEVLKKWKDYSLSDLIKCYESIKVSRSLINSLMDESVEPHDRLLDALEEICKKYNPLTIEDKKARLKLASIFNEQEIEEDFVQLVLKEESLGVSDSLAERLYKEIVSKNYELEHNSTRSDEELREGIDDLERSISNFANAPVRTFNDIAKKASLLCDRMREDNEGSYHINNYFLAESIRSNLEQIQE